MKKILFSLLGIITLGLINFSNAGFEVLQTGHISTLYSTNNLSNVNSFKYSLSSSDLGNIYCVSGTLLGISNSCQGTNQTPSCAFQVILGKDNSIYQYGDSILFYLNKLKFDTDNSFFGCIEYNYGVSESNQILFKTISSTNQSVNFDFELLKLTSDSSSCDYSGYILESEVNQSYCVNNNLCPSDSSNCDYSEYESTIQTLSGSLSTCQGMYDRLDSDYTLLEGNYNSCTSELSICLQNGGSSGSGDIQWSSLYINNIQHLGNKNIYIDIPSDYEFSYTNEGDNFELEVVGLEQDEEYLSGVINKSNYIPTSEDLSNVFSNLGLFGSLLVVCLFIILVFYMIKKIFN